MADGLSNHLGKIGSNSISNNSIVNNNINSGAEIALEKLSQTGTIGSPGQPSITLNNGSIIFSNGPVVLSGTSRNSKSDLVFNAEMMNIQNSLGSPASRSAISGTGIIKFVAGSIRRSAIRFEIPHDMDMSVNPKMDIHFVPHSNESAGSTACFVFDMRYISSGEQIGKAPDESITETVLVPSTKHMECTQDFTLNSSLMTSGDGVSAIIMRSGTATTDTRNGNISISLIEFEYTKNLI